VPIVDVQWSAHRAGVFYVLDALGYLHVFDLVADDSGPLVSEHCCDSGDGGARRLPPRRGGEGKDAVDDDLGGMEPFGGGGGSGIGREPSGGCCLALSGDRLLTGVTAAPAIAVMMGDGGGIATARRRALSAWLYRPADRPREKEAARVAVLLRTML